MPAGGAAPASEDLNASNCIPVLLFSGHPGEGRDPFLSRSASGSVDPGLRRDDDLGIPRWLRSLYRCHRYSREQAIEPVAHLVIPADHRQEPRVAAIERVVRKIGVE